MLRSRWSNTEAQTFIEKYAKKWGEAVALRTYSARLIGIESTLVLHGGGNTSVKSTITTITGEEREALFVKGSGWDLAEIEPEGHPAVDLNYLRTLRTLEKLSDEEMVNELRTHLFDASAPTPSVETLLHAFLPHAFIDHSHADSILTLTNTVDGEKYIADCFGKEVVVVPYIMPGFLLSKKAADLFDRSKECSGMVLLRHGLFTFGDTARESYERHIELANKAEAFAENLQRKAKRSFQLGECPNVESDRVLPILRGALSIRDERGVSKRFVTSLRSSDLIDDFLCRKDLKEVAVTPPLTPDHIIRTKELPIILNISANSSDDEIRSVVSKALDDFESSYREYFAHSIEARRVDRKMLDTKPRIALIPGLGLVGVGENKKAADIAADLYEHTIAVKTKISMFSEYKGLPELDLFDMEYWSLEQAKLGKKARDMEGQLALITGGTGAIGQGVAKVLRDAGVHVVIADIARVEEVSKELKVLGITMDVTSEESVRAAFSKVVKEFGGIDIVVPNAGIAISRPIEKLSASDAERVMKVNFHGYFLTMKTAGEFLKRQGIGGNIVVISSKTVSAPGKEFSLYSASKAAGHQLGKVSALEFAEFGVRVNMVTPDAVFGAGDSMSGLWKEVGPERAKARGLELSELENFYRERNLLKTRVTPEDVGRAVLFFASNQTPTTGASLPVDGGVAEAFPR